MPSAPAAHFANAGMGTTWPPAATTRDPLGTEVSGSRILTIVPVSSGFDGTAWRLGVWGRTSRMRTPAAYQAGWEGWSRLQAVYALSTTRPPPRETMPVAFVTPTRIQRLRGTAIGIDIQRFGLDLYFDGRHVFPRAR